MKQKALWSSIVRPTLKYKFAGKFLGEEIDTKLLYTFTCTNIHNLIDKKQ